MLCRCAGSGPLPSPRMRLGKKLAAGAAVLVLAAVVAGCGSAVSGGAVATVAGNQITLQAYRHWMYVAAEDQASQAAAQGLSEPVIVSSDPTNFSSCVRNIRAAIVSLRTASASTLNADCKTVFTQDTAQVLQFLIEGYWYQAEAAKLGIKAPNLSKDFQKFIKSHWPTKAAFASYSKSSGQTKQDLLFQFRVETFYTKMLARYEKPVTKAAIAAYYAKHKSTFGTPQSRDLHLLRTKTAAQAQAAVSALKGGQSWTVVARRYSAAATGKVAGGLLSGVTSGQFETAANKAIFSSPVGKLVGPIKGIFGYYVIQVTKITPATQQSLAKASTTIKSTLASAQQTAAASKAAALVKKTWFKRSVCRTPYQAQAVCSNYKAPPAPPATTSAATPAPATTTAGSGGSPTATGSSGLPTATGSSGAASTTKTTTTAKTSKKG